VRLPLAVLLLGLLGPGALGCKKSPQSSTDSVRASSEVVTRLPQAPDGFSWLACPDPLSCAFLVPDGWHTKVEHRDGTVGIFITKEPISPPDGHFSTGLSVNIIQDVPGKAQVKPSTYALAFLQALQDKGTADSEIGRYDAAGGIVVLDRYARLTPPDGSADVRVLYRLYANDVTGTLTLLFFEAPVDEWEQAVAQGGRTIDEVAISPND